jgi:hypothetical protein
VTRDLHCAVLNNLRIDRAKLKPDAGTLFEVQALVL